MKTPSPMETASRVLTSRMGLSHKSGMIPSMPKMLPYITPKNIDEIAASFMTCPREVRIRPRLTSSVEPRNIKSPCPTSPNMNPKKSMNESATMGDGSISP